MADRDRWEEGTGNSCSMGTESLYGMMRKLWRWTVVTAVQQCECTWCYVMCISPISKNTNIQKKYVHTFKITAGFRFYLYKLTTNSSGQMIKLKKLVEMATFKSYLIKLKSIFSKHRWALFSPTKKVIYLTLGEKKKNLIKSQGLRNYIQETLIL